MGKKYLSGTVNQFNYNVCTLRFLAAVSVILSHAYPISGNGRDLLHMLTGGDITLGSLAVYIFMFLGGLYAVQSLNKKQGEKKEIAFAVTKVKRLCPALFITVFITVFIIGAVFTEIPAGQYFTDKNTYRYLLNCIFIVQHKLPGVFESNVYSDSVNGSLWSLPLEVMCYVMAAALFKMRILSEKIPPAVTVIGIASVWAAVCILAGNVGIIESYRYHLHLCLIFIGGGGMLCL